MPILDGWHEFMPGLVETGEMAGDETKGFRMVSLPPGGFIEEHDLINRLHIVSGEAELYFKACTDTDNCTLTADELDDSKKPPSNVIKAQQKTAIKTLEYKVICGDNAEKEA